VVGPEPELWREDQREESDELHHEDLLAHIVVGLRDDWQQRPAGLSAVRRARTDSLHLGIYTILS